ncbi:hypothetical protein JIG36_35945 [Actinoplanes sp. LDG1-06]|uniref:Uncharacterized protein n=1 Tax=Paractinoplanes ovalisporus TaxID=2810368 RepID=A0ABS2AM14_9ACTN|nr:hypothetical protein [Actinoplanes ovalisporus]MBM2620907.1 hypothetical protein [Actinoplanes ovalisporus]
MPFEIDFHDNDAMIWSRPLTLLVSAAGAVLIGVAFVTPWTEWLVILGVVALFVAISGYIGSTLETKFGQVPLAQPSGVRSHAGPRRRSMRRSSGVPYVAVALGVLLVAASDGFPLVAAIGLALVLAGLIVGPAAGFVVTPEFLHIDTAFRRISVPRHLIGKFEHSDLEVRLRLENRDFVDIRVDSPIMEYSSRGYWMNARCRVRTTARLVRMLDAVPAVPGPQQVVTHRRRPLMIAVIVVAAAAIVVLAAYGVATTPWEE